MLDKPASTAFAFQQASRRPNYTFRNGFEPAEMALMARQSNDFERSRHILESGIRQFPQKALLWHDLAVTFRETGAKDDALRCSEKAYLLNRSDFRNALFHADMLRFYEMDDKAEHMYIDTLARFDAPPAPARALCGLGRLYLYNLEEFDLAAAALRHAHHLAPVDGIIWRHLDRAEKSGGKDTPEARAEIGRRVERFMSLPSPLPQADAPAPAPAVNAPKAEM
jgi:tetratricopeptide (TPR) repeat protein